MKYERNGLIYADNVMTISSQQELVKSVVALCELRQL